MKDINGVTIDVIHNGKAQGATASLLMNGMNPLALRPWIGEDGHSYVANVAADGKLQKIRAEHAATLRKDEWKLLDTAVIQAAQPRLRAVADLMQRGLTYRIPNGMGTTVFQSQAQSDITGAQVSMDGINRSEGDRPLFDLTTIPLPIISKDITFPAREIATSRRMGTPLDTSSVELASRKVAETAEKLLTGTYGTYAFGGGTIYGYANFPSALTKTITDWTGSAVTGSTVVEEVLEMKKSLQDAYHYGPYMMYVSGDIANALEEDFKAASDKTIRGRILEIEGIEGVRTLDYLDDGSVVMVEMTTETVRELIGMDIQTVQWDTDGGMNVNYKVMAILVPQLRADYNGNCGIMFGSTS